jgi:hypothetical protein
MSEHQATEKIDYGPTGGAPDPTFLHNTETDIVTINWHGQPRPNELMITTDLLEELIQHRNTLVRAAAEQGQRVSAMEMLLTIIRLGRRPNRSDWQAARLPALTKEVRLDLMSRKRRAST